MGRRKIAISKLKDEHQRHVTFCKRRSGLRSKVAEFCRQFNAQIAVIMTSPGKDPKVYSSSYGSTDAVVDAYLAGSFPIMESETKQKIESDYRKMKELEEEVKKEKAKQEKRNNGFWWEKDIDRIDSAEELEAYIDALEKLRANVRNGANNKVSSISASSTLNHGDVLVHGDHNDDFGLPAPSLIADDQACDDDFFDHTFLMETQGMAEEGNDNDELNVVVGAGGVGAAELPVLVDSGPNFDNFVEAPPLDPQYFENEAPLMSTYTPDVSNIIDQSVTDDPLVNMAGASIADGFDENVSELFWSGD